MSNCFIFRTDSNSYVQSELKQGRLRQGWSPPGTSLLNTNGGTRDKEEWSQAYKSEWNEDPSPRRYGILRRMLDMKQGDLIFCPKAPKYGCFTMAKVCGDYRFEVAADQGDFGHIIPVINQQVVANCYSQDSQTISELFKSAYFRSAITQDQEYKVKDVIGAADRLMGLEGTDTPGDPDKILEQNIAESRSKAAASFMEFVNEKWSFDQFENAVGEVFKRKGYGILRRQSSRNGGDADYVLSLPLPGFDGQDFYDRTPVLIVQVKHKQGTDYNDVKGVDQLVNWHPSEDEEVLYKVLLSSAEEFTDPCRKKAENHGVILICGIEAGLFML